MTPITEIPILAVKTQEDEPAVSVLGRQARLAVLWNAGLTLFRDLLQFVVMVVLVRLLAPKAYGQFGMVTTITGFLNVLSFGNFLAYTLQVRRDEDVHYQDHFTAGAFIQFCIFLIANVIAFALRFLPAYAEVAPLVHIMSLVFLLDWPSELRIRMLERALDWRRRRLLQAMGMLIGAVAAVALAAMGAGAYALIVQGLLASVPFIFDLFLIQRWRPTWTWSAKNYASACHFGGTRMMSGLAGTGRQLMESGVLVQLIGFAKFGIYGRAIGIAQIFCFRFAYLLTQAVYPVLTKIEPGTHAYSRASALLLRTVGWIVVPLGVLFAVLADPLVKDVYGQKWLEAIPLLPWAMAGGVAASICSTAYQLLLGNQQARRCFFSDLWILIGTGLSLFAFAPKGVVSYLIAMTVIQVTALVMLLGWLYADRAITVPGIVSAIIWPAVAALSAFAICEVTLRWRGIVKVETFYTAVAYGIGFGFVYLAVLRLLFGSQLAELIQYFPGSRRLSSLLMLRSINNPGAA